MSFTYLDAVPYCDEFRIPTCQTVDIWHRDVTHGLGDQSGYWVIFIHGGAWRDPDIDSSFADAAVKLLQGSAQNRKIDGFASINYRLSPHPKHISSPSLVNDPSRNAIHPDHLCDVQASIKYLQRQFRFQDRYVLVGHSCGATLAFQTIFERSKDTTKSTVPPQAIVGVAGIYDLALLRDMDPYPPSCQYFLSQAFGTDEQVWERASPAKGDYVRNWPEGLVTILMKCSDDEYVSPVQLDVMENALKSWYKQESKNIEIHTVYGAHDDCWKLGSGLVFGINRALAHLITEKQDVVV